MSSGSTRIAILLTMAGLVGIGSGCKRSRDKAARPALRPAHKPVKRSAPNPATRPVPPSQESKLAGWTKRLQGTWVIRRFGFSGRKSQRGSSPKAAKAAKSSKSAKSAKSTKPDLLPVAIPTIWDIRGAKVKQIDAWGKQSQGAFRVVSACLLEVKGQRYAYLLRGKTLHLAIAKKAALVFCNWSKGGTQPGSGAPKQRTRRRAKLLYSPKMGYRVGVRVADLTTAKKLVLAHNQRSLLPYGLRFGTLKKQIEKRFSTLKIGSSTCRFRVKSHGPAQVGIEGKKSPPWDTLALPHLGLPVINANCLYNSKGQLDKIVLTMRPFNGQIGHDDDGQRSRRIFAKAERLMTALVRLPPAVLSDRRLPAKPTEAQRYTKRWERRTWRTPGVHITLSKVASQTEYPQDDWHDLATIKLRFVAAAGYRPHTRMKLPAAVPLLPRVKTVGSKAASAIFPPHGLRLGMPRSKAVQKLKRRGIKPTARPMTSDPKNPTPFDRLNCPKGNSCKAIRYHVSTYLGVSAQSVHVVFANGRLSSILIKMPIATPYEQLLIFQRLYSVLSRSLGVRPGGKANQGNADRKDFNVTAHAWNHRQGRVTLRMFQLDQGAPSPEAAPELLIERAPGS